MFMDTAAAPESAPRLCDRLIGFGTVAEGTRRPCGLPAVDGSAWCLIHTAQRLPGIAKVGRDGHRVPPPRP